MHHIDAVFAIIALVLPECRELIEAHERVTVMCLIHANGYLPISIVPLGTSKKRAYLNNTFFMPPEYLKTDLDDEVSNYPD
jgi:aromatic-L-amino-acid decarboxylase